MNADSIKAKLKQQAFQKGHLFQQELVTYALERTIYRISISKYNKFFTLKGGVFLYALFDGDFTRATKDIDLLAKRISNEIEEIERVFKEIFLIQVNDALIFDLESIRTQKIVEFKRYPGINISIIALLDKTKIPVSIDIGFGDTVYPYKVLMEFPVLLDMEAPLIFAYSLVSVIAEKFEAIVSLGFANSRYKDFYDLFILLGKFDFDGKELTLAIKETFKARGSDFSDIVAFESSFYMDQSRVTQWNSFIKKKHAITVVEFSVVVAEIKDFLEPIVFSINNHRVYEHKWIALEKRWREL
jgi:hypothetical protein